MPDISSRLPSTWCMPKVVRDMLWTVTSPHLLNENEFPVLPSIFGIESLKFDIVIDWLNDLVADATPLLEFLQKSRAPGLSLALGVYFSSLLEFWLRFCPYFQTKRMEIGKQIVSSTNRTMGQLKFLFRCNFSAERDCDFHVESSIKFFLLSSSDSKVNSSPGQHKGEDENGYIPLEMFVGPHLGESLAWRVQEVKRKLAMRRGESICAWLKENYSENVESHIVLRGYLFLPLHRFVSTSHTTIAHDWFCHRNPIILATDLNRSMNSNTFSNPSISTDHLRGWWTVNVETDLPGKVKANDQITLGKSQFVILPKLHWLSPIVATEIKGSGCVIVGGNDELDIPNAEAITLEELLVFVRQLYSEHSSAKQNVTKGKLVPLLVAEIVRCPKSVELTVDDNLQYWYELSRGFILDPQSWNPSLLSHEPVQLKCSMNDTGHESEIDRVKQVDEAFIKPEILARSIQQQHKFADPLNVRPRELCHELLALLGAKNGCFSYNDLKRSTKDLFRSRRCKSAEILSKNCETNTHCDNESAYLRSCMEYLVLDVSNTDGAKRAQRVGYLMLEVLKTLNCELGVEGLGTSSLLECDAWVVLLTEVSQNIQRWDFLHLVIRAIDLSVLKAHIIEWRGSNLNRRLHFLDQLLAARKFRWNAVAVEVIRVFHIGTHKGLDKYAEDAETARNIFNELLEQKDWQNAERLAVVIQELDMVETLLRQLSLLNMTKAVKRLQNSAIQCEHRNLSVRSMDDRINVLKPDHTPCGKPIDHEKNRSLYQDIGSELRWKYVHSIEDIWEIIRHLEKYESASYSEDNGRERVVIRNLLVGIDCEWQPQTPMKQQRTVVNGHMQHRKVSSDDQTGLSIYQLAIGDVVYLIDVQVLGATAAAPLRFIWRPSSRLMLIGFCVSSDLQRIKVSFPELKVILDRNGRDAVQQNTCLLLELKQLALFRNIPAKNWGLARLYRSCFGKILDKQQQCSNWSNRPLSNSQIEYAARDVYAVQRLSFHLLADVDWNDFSHHGAENGSEESNCREFLTSFDAGHKFWQTGFLPQPLGQVHIKTVFNALGVECEFMKCDEIKQEGVLVKSIAIMIRTAQSSVPIAQRYAVVVLRLDESIDMEALGTFLHVNPKDICLADQETLVRIFGYTRGCLGPIGLREQQAIRVIIDRSLVQEQYLFCGAGAADEVYAIAPDVLITIVNAFVTKFSR